MQTSKEVIIVQFLHCCIILPTAEVKKILNKVKERANINAFKTLKIQDEIRKKVKNEINKLMTQCNYYSVVRTNETSANFVR